MKLHMATYFAVRITLECARVEQGGLISGVTISEEINMTYGYFCRLSNLLIKANILASIQGRNGGYYLARPASAISLYDIQQATAQTVANKKDWNNAKIEKYYDELEQLNIRSLKEQTIDKFL